MKTPRSLALVLTAVLGASPLLAQNGLRDIPDTDPAAQLASFQAPEGATVQLFAAEPLLTKPIHMNWDTRGRLWVVGSPLYPHIKPGQEESDCLYILEDTDGDGKADKSTVFADDLHIPTGVLPGDGGVYVANSTEILFLRDTDGDDKADERRVLLSGFGTEDTHHLVHTLRWGPAGQVWMNQSIYIHTHLETPYGIRRLLGGGMWHYRPETQRAEIFMKGLINPWGHVFDQWGQSFLTDGAGGEGINFVFPRSVFRTSPGATRILTGLNPGQPKHCGVEVLDGRHLPEEYRDTLAAPDFRGHRINRFRLTDNASAYTSTQVPDLVASTHRAFRPIDIKMGPDGAIYVADWYNPIIQHGEVDFRDPRRDHEHGRIWRISFEGRDLVAFPDLPGSTAEELVALLEAPESLTRELAMVEMRQRDPSTVLPHLSPPSDAEDFTKLRRLWALQAVNEYPLDLIAELCASENHKIRAAALRALYYRAGAHATEALSLAEAAVADPHPQVRLWGVSVLAQLPQQETVRLALRALDGVEIDDFLDFAVWNICREHEGRWVEKAKNDNPFDTIEQLLFAVRAINRPVAMPQILSALQEGTIETGRVPEVADWIARTGSADDLGALFDLNVNADTPPFPQAAALQALVDAASLRKIQPSGDKERITGFLTPVSNDDVFALAATLAGRWKIASARPLLEEAFRQAGRNAAALEGLRLLGGQPTVAFLEGIANDTGESFRLRSLAVIGRAKMNPKAGAALALGVLRETPDGRDPHGIFDAFLANKQGTVELATLLESESLPEPIALTGLNKAGSAATRPERLIAALQKAGGIEPMKMALTDEEMEAMMDRVARLGDPHRGEKIYRRQALQCMVCHAIGGVGGIIGPDLVSIGSSAPVDYLIDSLLQPSKKIKEGYHTTLVTLKNGDSFAGAIAGEDANELVIRDAAGNENRIPKSEIASNQISPVSLMPPGLTLQLREDEFVDLVRFMAELGKEGEFKTLPNRYIREWEVLVPHERTRDAIGHYGNKIFAEDFPTYQWIPLLATVDGSLPVEETPQVQGRGRNRYAVGRFFLDVPQAGTIRLRVEGKLKDLDLFHGEAEIDLPGEGGETIVEIAIEEPGAQKITASGLKGYGLDRIRIELLDDAATVAPAVAGTP